MFTREDETRTEIRYLTGLSTDGQILAVLKNIAISLAQIVDMMREGSYQ